MAVITRYTNTITGALTMTGNAGGLYRTPSTLNPGNTGNTGPGAWITLDTALATPATWVSVVSIPNGENVTYNWQQSSSAAMLTIPAGSVVKHAELIWSGIYYSSASGGTFDLTTLTNNPVTLVNPSGTQFLVTPDTITRQFFISTSTPRYYTISANVTSIVSSGLSGKYIVKGIPAGLTAAENNPSMGWVLIVAYYNSAEKLRNLNIYTAMEGISSSSPPVDFTITGFRTPVAGNVQARAIIAAGEGDVTITGDSIRMGRNIASLVTLSGPNNFANNFFCAQINNNSGTLDTSGTFGNRNAVPGTPGTLTFACRYGWDITSVDASAAMTINQTSAVFRLSTSGDTYYVSGMGIQIDSLDQPNFTSLRKGGPSYADVGETITYTIEAVNEGNTDSFNTILRDTIPNGLTFVSNSVAVNGVTVPGVSPLTGIYIGTISAATAFTITFQCVVSTTIPTPNPIVNNAFATYYYLPAVGLPTIAASIISPNKLTQINNAALTMSKTSSSNYAGIGTILTYTVLLNNSGNTNATNVVFIDTIPDDTTFVNGSFRINGVTIPGNPNPPGINLGTIPVGLTTLSFKVTVNTIPSPNSILNSATAVYNYTIDPTILNGGSGTANSNINNVQVNSARVEMTKSSDSNHAHLGGTITYTILINNSGNASAANVVFSDTIPSGTAFVNGSFSVNGTTIAGSPNPPGINLGTIPVGTTTVSFKVTVVTIPTINSISNSATTSFNYTIDPSTPNGGASSSNSNIIEVEVPSGTVLLIKNSDINYADIGSTITYTILLENSGTDSIANVVLSDTIPNGTSYVDGSFTINETTIPGSPNPPGLNLGTIPVGMITASFKVTVNTIPSPNPIPNSATVTYNYTIDPSVPYGGSGSINSKINNVMVNSARIEMAKVSDTNYADIGSIISYTILINNSGSTNATDVLFSDTIPDGTEFLDGTFSVNGATIAGSPNPPGINLGIIPVGATTVSFKVIVVTIPTVNPIQNSVTASFQYTINPSTPNDGSGSGNSNTNNIEVNHARLAMTKTSDSDYSDIGSTITYTVEVTNSGNVSAVNVVFTDSIPSGTEFLHGSFSVNGTTIAGSPTPPGINLGTIPVGVTTLTFKVSVVTIPTPNPILNSATSTYNYTVDPSVPAGGVGSNNSNINSVTVNNATVAMTKVSDLTYADIGSTITYTIEVNNSGNVSATNVVFLDTIPSGAVFISDSLRVNGETIVGNPNPPGIDIGNIPVGVTTVSFKVIVASIPSPNPIPNSACTSFNYIVDPSTPKVVSGGSNSNINNVTVNNATVAMTKISDLAYGDVGTTITYTILINNSGSVSAANVLFMDTIPSGSIFVSDSLMINGVTISDSPNPPGINLGTIPVGVTTVSFKVVVVTIPSPNPIENSATASFNYTVDPSVPNVGSGSSNSNTAYTQINHGQLIAFKSVDKKYASCSDILKYTILITNTGNVGAENILFRDTIVNGTQFINNSFTVNGVTIPGVDPITGVNIATIPAGTTSTLTFQVVVMC